MSKRRDARLDRDQSGRLLGRRDGRVTDAEMVRLYAFLRARGVAARDLTSAVGLTAGGRRRQEVLHQLIEWLRTRPKAEQS